MINIYRTDDNNLYELSEIVPDSWINLVAPTEEELVYIMEELNVEKDFLYAAMDEEERSRVEIENGQTLILVDTPVIEPDGDSFTYSTLPVAIIMTKENLITVSLQDFPLLKYYTELKKITFTTKKRNRFVLQILYRNATLYLSYLKLIDKTSNKIQLELHKSMKNKEIIEMLQLENSLVYFSTSLKGNELVLERLLRMSFIKAYPDDEDLLEDVIIENKQAIEMCHIYMDILKVTMDAFASVISNNINNVMKLLTSITIILTIPTLVASLWGMNVNMPFQNHPYGFYIVVGISFTIAIIVALFMSKRRIL